MAISYSWSVTKLECYPEYKGQSNVVITAYWERRAVDGQYTANLTSQVNVRLTPTQRFIPFDQLKEADVIGWIETTMTLPVIGAIDASLAQQIAQQQAPKVSPPLPWSV